MGDFVEVEMGDCEMQRGKGEREREMPIMRCSLWKTLVLEMLKVCAKYCSLHFFFY